MALVPMTKAVRGRSASSSANNAIIDNVLDLDTRLSSVEGGIGSLGSRLSTVESRTTHPSTGNIALGNRVSALESSRFAKYRRSTGTQTLPAGVYTKVQFPTADHTNPAVVPGGTNNDQFTLNAVGLWTVTASVVIRGSSSSTGNFYLHVTELDPTFAHGAMGAQALVDVGAQLNVTGEVPVTAVGKVIYIRVYNGSDSSQTISSTSLGGTPTVTFKWQPL